MSSSGRKRRARISLTPCFIIALLIFIFDQFSKIWIRGNFRIGQSVEIVDKHLHITHVENPGAAFSVLRGRESLLIGVSLAIVIILLYILIREKALNSASRIGISMAIGGGAGNLADRAIYGRVTDMIDVSFFPPVFNLADIAVTIGCLVLVFGLIAGRRR